jgi:hypothetical protein
VRIALGLIAVGAMVAVSCSGNDANPPKPTATQQEAPATTALLATSTPAPLSTATEEPTATAVPQPTQPQVTNRQDCAAIRGTSYLSEDERQWFQSNCVPTPVPRVTSLWDQNGDGCHDSYVGACLDPSASDYDCAGGSGNGPLYTGPVQVVGSDTFDLDRDHDGYGCE